MNLGTLHRERGDLASARVALEEAAKAAAVGDAQTSIGIARGLAALLAFEDPRAARQHAEAAVEESRVLGYTLPGALLTAGWVALARHDRAAAVEYAREAAVETQRQRLRLEFAEALELQAMTEDTTDSALALLEEARSIWRDAGNEVAVARDDLATARLTGDRRGAAAAERTLRSLGVRERAAGQLGLPASIPRDEPEPVRVQTLGSFSLLRARANRWRSASGARESRAIS